MHLILNFNIKELQNSRVVIEHLFLLIHWTNLMTACSLNMQNVSQEYIAINIIVLPATTAFMNTFNFTYFSSTIKSARFTMYTILHVNEKYI
jgi:hypothetical protein